LEDIIREGAGKALRAAIENEAAASLDLSKEIKDDKGRRVAAGRGSLPERSIPTGTGSLLIKQSTQAENGGAYGVPSKIQGPPKRTKTPQLAPQPLFPYFHLTTKPIKGTITLS
jgi:hypothetical protein